MDLSDNAIMQLEGFPMLPRLKSLYLSNNKITRIGKNLEGKALRLLYSTIVIRKQICIDAFTNTHNGSVDMLAQLVSDLQNLFLI